MKFKIIFLAILMYAFYRIAWAGDNFLKGYQLGDWKVDSGIEERLRYEYKSDFDFNKNVDDSGSLFFNRARLNGKFSLEDKFEIFLEVLDARVGCYRIKKTAQADDMDLHQAYLKINRIMDSNFDVKMGRQEIQYGKGRLLAAPTWANRINAFDAVTVHYAQTPYYGDAVIGFNVKYDDHNPNHITDEEILNGLYLGYQKDKKSPLLEVYSLNLVDNNKSTTGHIHRYTVGLRLQAGLWKGFTYDFEAPYQFGDYGTKDIKAYALHLDLNQGFDVALKPKLTLEFNLASGDKKSSDNEVNTFVPLYQTTHAPYGIMDFFRWQNMREIAGSFTITPIKKLQLTAGVNFFWLDNIHDSWYNSSGSKLRTGIQGNEHSFVGTETSLVGKYDLTKEIQVEGGYAHFFSGPYVKDTGAHNDADWLYSQISLKF